jgi:TIR domain
MRNTYLFAEEASIHDVVEHRKQQVQQTLDELPSQAIVDRPVDELIAEFVERFRLNVPVLDRPATVQLPNEEVDIDVSQDPMRGIFDRSEPFYVKGTTLRIAVPFTGEAVLFKYGTAPYPYGQPIPGEIADNNLVLSYVAEHPDLEAVGRDFENRLGQIEQALQMTRGSAEEWNRRLPEIARARLEQRRSKLERDRGLTLGYPAAPQKPKPAVHPAAPAKIHNKKECDLFLSHASEDKESIARPLYAALSAAGVSVWFDEAVLEIGDSLRQKIDEGLARSRYGVVILSPRFLNKQWPQRELDGLVARETASGEKAILPIWHELDRDTLLRYSPPLADRLAGRSEEGIASLVEKILRVLKK